MSIKECRKKSKEILKGKYAEGFVVSFALISVLLMFKTIDLMLASAAVYAGGSGLAELISGGGIAGAALSILRHFLCFAITVPVLTGGLWWYFQTALGKDNKNILKVYSGFRLNIRAAAVYAIMWARGFISLIPTGLCWAGAWISFGYACTEQNQGIWLFITVQMFAAGVFLLGLYIYATVSAAAAPFLFIMRPDTGAFRSVRMSRRLMKGRKSEFVKLILCYVPSMLPIVTIPFVLPRAVMSAALFISEEAEGGRAEV